MNNISYKLKIKGIVQGVGFRPFVYNLAIKYDIKGWVNNDDMGVNIVINSTSKACDDFINELRTKPPKLSKIDDIIIEKITLEKEFKSFEIRESETSNSKTTIISPDIAICDDCIKDIEDKSNHRYNYALTNCTNCGPRYSIMKTIPYDRCNTSMHKFKLCQNCKIEYKNPLDRRYHAQPISCNNCGPKLKLYNIYNKVIKEDIKAIEYSVKLIEEGKIIAIKGIGGFHIVCDSTNDKTILALRERKNRKSKPFAVLFKDLKDVKRYTYLTLKEEEILSSKEKPIVIVRKKEDSLISSYVAPNINHLGVFISYTPLHHLLFKYLSNPIVATSANLKDEPIIRFKDELFEKLGNIVDYVLDFDRDIVNACDDSLIQVVRNTELTLRNARGYAPSTFKLQNKTLKNILALGTNQKSTISLCFENNLILSPHIGNLNSIQSVEYLSRTIETFKRFYDFEPEIIVCDKHPNYESTKFAFNLKKQNPNIRLIQVQHHYAHILSTMAEYNIKEKVLGFSFDGTGYGDDGNIWGGEVFVCDNKEYERVYHLNYFRLLGGEKALKEPKRVALSLLFDSFSIDEVLNMKNYVVNQFKIQEIKLLHKMWQKGLHAPLCSSFGRVFDAVSSLADILHFQSYEGECGLQIEKYYDKDIKESYSYEFQDKIIDISSMVKQILKDKDKRIICSKFINTIVNIILDISNKNKDLPVVLSGGVFQNRVLLDILMYKFELSDTKIYFSKTVPLNDGGISSGQAYFCI